MLETLKSFVNTWECDENDHLNVQFYFERFDDADRHFRLKTGLDLAATGRRISRHVRYHRECYVGGLQIIRSGLYEADDTSLIVIHVLVDAGSGAISATALDRYALANPLPGKALRGLPAPSTTEDLAARPRSFQDAIPGFDVKAGTLERDGVITSFYGSVKPAHCNVDGFMEDRFIIASMSDAAAHVWQVAPMTQAWLDQNNYGRVAVEMRLTYGEPLAAGTPTKVMSKWRGAERTTFSFRHHLINAATGLCQGIVDTAGLVMDLEKRKSVRLSEAHRVAIHELAGGPDA